MSKEYTDFSKEYVSAPEQQPSTDYPLTETSEYFEPGKEFFESGQESDVAKKLQTVADANHSAHVSTVKKMVYTVASVATVLTLAQTIPEVPADSHASTGVITELPDNTPIPTIAALPTKAPTPTITTLPSNIPVPDGYFTTSISTDNTTITISGSGELTGTAVDVILTQYIIDGFYNIIIDEGITKIEEDAFAHDIKLCQITLPDSLVEIGARAFNGCNNAIIDTLTTANRTICGGAFQEVTINEVIISESFIPYISGVYVPFGKANINSVSFEDGITSIPENALRSCKTLTSITIPDSVTEIGSFAFSGCENAVIDTLTTANRTINGGAFQEVTINEVVMSESFQSLRTGVYYAFSSANILNTIYEKDIRKIPENAFASCILYTKIELPDSVTEIGDHAFRNCNALSSIELPDSVTTIGIYAFNSCEDLVSVSLPESVTAIGTSAFGSNSDLTLYVISGSYAEQYAIERSLTYVTLE